MIIATANEDGTVDLLGLQGTTWSWTLTLFEDDEGLVPFDLTNYLARGQYRKNHKVSTAVAIDFDCTVELTGDNNIISLVVLPIVSAEATLYEGVYDIEIYNADESLVERPMQGKLTISQEVTRP